MLSTSSSGHLRIDANLCPPRHRVSPLERLDTPYGRCYNIGVPCGSGGIGRRARLRGVWVKPWGFKSPLPHQITEVRARGSVGERFVHTEEVAGSNPAVPIRERLRRVAGAF